MAVIKTNRDKGSFGVCFFIHLFLFIYILILYLFICLFIYLFYCLFAEYNVFERLLPDKLEFMSHWVLFASHLWSQKAYNTISSVTIREHKTLILLSFLIVDTIFS